MARHFGMAIAPWGALGSGRFQTPKQLKERKEKLRRGGDLTEQEVRMSDALSKVAAEHGIESVTAVALAYVMHKAPYVSLSARRKGPKKKQKKRQSPSGTSSGATSALGQIT